MRWLGTAAVVAGFLIAAACLQGAAADPTDSAIAVAGNRHVGADVIRSSFPAAKDGWFSAVDVDTTLKRLYATGLFQDVKIVRSGARLIVTVVENPTIGVVAFEGNHKIKDDDLKKVVQSKSNGPLSRAMVQSDVVHMQELYRQHGYYDVHIVPSTIAPGKGAGKGVKSGKNGAADRLNLVFEIKENDKLTVRQIAFAGNTAFSSTKLKGVVQTGTTNLLSFILNNDTYDPDRIENDTDLVRRYYRNHGYADVRISTATRYDETLKGVVLTFRVDEGALYHLGAVKLEATPADEPVLRAAMHTQAGDVYNADALDKSVEDMTMALAKTGEPFADVKARVEREPGGRAINLVYTVGQGKRLYVERIEIHGNTRTHDEVIRREFDFNEGDAYNRALVERAERRLKALGYFKTVKIETAPGSAPDRVALTVDVEERQTGNFFVSGGYSTTDGALAQVSISDTNFLGTGDIAKATVTYGQYARGFDVSFTDPWFLGQHLGVGVDAFGRQSFANTYQAFNTSLYGAKLGVSTPIDDNLNMTWTYSIYNQGLSLDPAFGTASLPIQLAAQSGSHWVSSIGNSTTYSTLDNPKDPTNGLRIQTNNEFAGLGGAANFAKTTEDARYYHPIAGDVVGMVRAQSGYAVPWGGQQLPLLDGFFGGPQLIRGFAPNGFGPRDITPGTTMDNLGGNAYWTLSAELQAPVPFIPPDANLKVSLFSDTGSLWATGASSVPSLATSLSPAQQIANSRALRASAGVGLTWDSMFGPITIDYAYPLAKQNYDVTQRFQFSAGGF